ncbi:MAG: SiaC family regulatory phosphoprotein, partial [Bacteroidales bacterium]
METIVKEASSHTPMVEFYPDGKLKMEGRSYPEDASQFFDPLISFVSELESNSVILDMNLEYFNTASSKKIMDLFRHLDA